MRSSCNVLFAVHCDVLAADYRSIRNKDQLSSHIRENIIITIRESHSLQYSLTKQLPHKLFSLLQFLHIVFIISYCTNYH